MAEVITQLAAVGIGHIFRPLTETLGAGLVGENSFLMKNPDGEQRLLGLGMNGWMDFGPPPVQLPDWELVRALIPYAESSEQNAGS